MKTHEPKILMAQESYIEWKLLQKHLQSLKIALRNNDLKVIKNLLVEIGTFYKN